MKLISMSLKITDRKTGKKEHIKCLIRDAVSITRYSDMQRAFTAYRMCKEQGQNCSFTRGVLTQHWEGMSKEQIAKKTLKDFEATKKEMNKVSKMRYVFFQEEIER